MFPLLSLTSPFGVGGRKPASGGRVLTLCNFKEGRDGSGLTLVHLVVFDGGLWRRYVWIFGGQCL